MFIGIIYWKMTLAQIKPPLQQFDLETGKSAGKRENDFSPVTEANKSWFPFSMRHKIIKFYVFSANTYSKLDGGRICVVPIKYKKYMRIIPEQSRPNNLNYIFSTGWLEETSIHTHNSGVWCLTQLKALQMDLKCDVSWKIECKRRIKAFSTQGWSHFVIETDREYECL